MESISFIKRSLIYPVWLLNCSAYFITTVEEFTLSTLAFPLPLHKRTQSFTAASDETDNKRSNLKGKNDSLSNEPSEGRLTW